MLNCLNFFNLQIISSRFVEIVSKNKCIPIEYTSIFRLSDNNVPFTLCTEQLGFMNKEILEILDKCSKACTTFQYSGTIVTFPGVFNNSRTIGLGYWFNGENEMAVSEEYLIYEITGVIGSIGGTLGLFVGFSFLDLSTKLIDIFKKKFLNSNS